MHKLKSSRLYKAYKIYSKIFWEYLILIWIKLQETALWRFDQPTFDLLTKSFTTKPSKDILRWDFKYFYILDELKAAFYLLWTQIISS